MMQEEQIGRQQRELRSLLSLKRTTQARQIAAEKRAKELEEELARTKQAADEAKNKAEEEAKKEEEAEARAKEAQEASARSMRELQQSLTSFNAAEKAAAEKAAAHAKVLVLANISTRTSL
jgi:membrane protein involved in colicin uptake